MIHTAIPAVENPLYLSRRVKRAIVGAILCCSVFSNIGININGYILELSLIAQYVLSLAMLSSFTGGLDTTNGVIVAVAIPLATLSLFANHALASPSSLLLLFALYLPYVVILVPAVNANDTWRWAMEKFSAIALFCATIGIVQFFAQRSISAPWLFNFAASLPQPFAAPKDYNTVYSTGSFIKSNGFFFREPSSFSQFMALAIVGEWVTHKRKLRLALFGLAMLLSYSGTGILVLALASLFPISRRTVMRLVLLCTVAAAVLLVLGDTLHLWFLVKRVGEFGSEGSSARDRFIAPIHLLLDTSFATWWAPFIGQGPGTISRIHENYEFHDPTWAKLFFEYGAAGTILFVTLMLRSIRRFAAPAEVKAALLFLDIF